MSSLDSWAETAELALVEHRASGDASPTLVYVLTGRPDGAVKIGITEHPTKRVRRIQKGMHEVYREPIIMAEFMVMATRDAAREVEAEAHRIMRIRHTGVGEWFYCTPQEALDAIHKAIGLPV